MEIKRDPGDLIPGYSGPSLGAGEVIARRQTICEETIASLGPQQIRDHQRYYNQSLDAIGRLREPAYPQESLPALPSGGKCNYPPYYQEILRGNLLHMGLSKELHKGEKSSQVDQALQLTEAILSHCGNFEDLTGVLVRLQDDPARHGHPEQVMKDLKDILAFITGQEQSEHKPVSIDYALAVGVHPPLGGCPAAGPGGASAAPDHPPGYQEKLKASFVDLGLHPGKQKGQQNSQVELAQKLAEEILSKGGKFEDLMGVLKTLKEDSARKGHPDQVMKDLADILAYVSKRPGVWLYYALSVGVNPPVANVPKPTS